MIRLKRPKEPDDLRILAASELPRLQAQWKSGLEPAIKARVYGCAGVRRALRRAQGNHCAYCQSENPRAHNPVEHFRPKAGWRNTRQDTLVKPGYFWLAYDWDNLLLSCPMCNDAGHKQNLFPLHAPAGRADAIAQNIAGEIPLLINPYDEDPADHIEWAKDFPRAKAGSIRGKISIDTFKLDQDIDLVDSRRGSYNLVCTMLEVAEGLPPGDAKRAKIKVLLKKASRPKALYSAMIRSNFSQRIKAL